MKYSLVLLLLIICACSSSEEPATGDTDQSLQSPKPRVRELPMQSEFIVGVDNLRLRAKPGREGDEVARLPESTMVVPTGEVSDFKSQLSLRGIPYDEPWLEVQTGQLKGWVFGGALDFDPWTSQMNLQLFEDRLKHLFGNSLASEVLAYYKQSMTISTAEDIQQAFEKCRTLKERLNKILAKKVSFTGPAPNLIWMQKGVPGLKTRQVAEGTGIQFFLDYGIWKKGAKTTTNAADDQFFEWLDQYNGQADLEGQFTNFFYQIADYEGQSELGEGKHYDLLKKAETYYSDQTIFSNSYKPYVDLILKDILDKDMTYKNALSPINAEMTQINSSTWTVISVEQLAELQQRQLDFKDHVQKKILLDGKNKR